MISPLEESALRQAIAAARAFEGATAPNPPVGAVILDAQGKVLVLGAHEKAGQAHAEILAIENAQKAGVWEQRHTLIVTLEPCNHTGRTPPCTDAILKSGFKRVIAGTRDPNPAVRGGGLGRLLSAGVETEIASGNIEAECRELIRSFSKWVNTGQPWVTVKRAFTAQGSMIPPSGQKTFTSEKSLELAHSLRKRADALWTTAATILADQPEFTVRRVQDHPAKKRWLVVMDRRKQLPREWVKAAQARGFEIVSNLELQEVLPFLGSKGCLEVLVEVGPTFSQVLIDSGLWDEQVNIRQGPENATEDSIEILHKTR